MRHNYSQDPRPHTHCSVCQKPLYGRSDKVFCDLTCKNHFHSDNDKKFKTVAHETQKLLKRNYILLCQLMGKNGKKFKISMLELKRMGFQLDVVSRVDINSKKIRMIIFEFAWTHAGKDTIEVVLEKPDIEISPFIYRRWEQHLHPLETGTESKKNSSGKAPPHR